MPILRILNNKEIIETAFCGAPSLSEALERAGFPLDAPCGGKGKCGKCEVELRQPSGEFSICLACKTVINGDAEVRLPENYGKTAVVQADTGEINVGNALRSYAAALDIGTTTLALKLYTGNGSAVAQAVGLNSQRVVSADVIGRIAAALNGESYRMKEQIAHAINRLLAEVCERADIDISQIEKTVITGNTAMLYLLCGLNPKSISASPFKADNLFDIHINEPVSAYLPPCINAFVGADLTCALLASGMCEMDETALLCDIGTNGEMALWKNGRLYVTSAAAGPAFEGAEISCGCGCVEGAVDAVWAENGGISLHTVGDGNAEGICGSGLIDAVSVFLQLGYIDKSGASPKELKLPTKGNPIYITNQDVRALQLAKSALRSAMEMLLESTSTKVEEVKALYLSGGFGNRLNLESAVNIGLIPKELLPCAKAIGNGALTGAAMMLFDYKAIEQAREMVKNAEHIELGGNDNFNKRFIDNMAF